MHLYCTWLSGAECVLKMPRMASCGSPSFTQVGHDCRTGGASPYSELEPLLKAMRVPCLSRAVQQSVLPVAGWSGSVELDPIVADCLLALQRYLVHHMPAVYHAAQDAVTPLLLSLRLVSLLTPCGNTKLLHCITDHAA